MILSQQTLLHLLDEDSTKEHNSIFYSLKEKDPGFLSPIQMAHLYTNSALLITVMNFLSEELWLQDKEDQKTNIKTSYEDFISAFLFEELEPVFFLKDFLISSGASKIKKISTDTQLIEAKVLSLIAERSSTDQKDFLVQALTEMNKRFVLEEKDQEGRLQSLGHKGLRLYRTYDNLDSLLDLNYQLDKDMIVDLSSNERLFESGGVGVQSGYSSILLALNSIDLKKGNKVIDLGSGYGRVGLVCSLLRPDVNFVGYEYVPHRVDDSNESTIALGLEENLVFKTQDLSLKSFEIPEADVYYLYDSFSDETYRFVLDQIVEISKKKDVIIITKGNARVWLDLISKENSWLEPLLIDEGNICIYKSRNNSVA